MIPQDEPQTFLSGVDCSGIRGSELTRVIVGPVIQADREYERQAQLRLRREGRL